MFRLLTPFVLAYALVAIAVAAPNQTLSWEDVERGELPAALEEALNHCIQEDILDRGFGEPCLDLTGTFQPDERHAEGDWAAMRDLNRFWTTYWDKRLNKAYRAIRTIYASQAASVDTPQALLDQLRDTQLRWIAWRDAKCAFEGVYQQDTSRWAKLKPAVCQAQMTALRALELELIVSVISD
ncbi:MAG: lysozyme inhibitor LprI family protein [Pseudomonadota bacterium]